MSAMDLGIRYDVEPIPPLDEFTKYLDAGSVKIGVEYRELNDDILAANFSEGTDAADIVFGAKPETLDDTGMSVHVFDAASNREWLRFDMFDGDPHYHYIVPDEYNLFIKYDPAGQGDMFEWVLECLRSRLPQMLEFAGNTQLAANVDQAAVDRVIPQVVEAMQTVKMAASQ